MFRASSVFVLACGIVTLSGCKTPFAQSARYDPRVDNAYGTITVSDPKLYSREALINERARETARIQKLIDTVDSAEFKPDIIREIEIITAVTAALGIKRDPAAGSNAERADESAEIQQEIRLERQKFQLEQLRRDLELLRAKLPEQTEPVNTDLGKSTADAPVPVTSSVTAPTVDTIIARIDKLLEASKNQLDKDGKSAALSAVKSNPFDDFRDKQAYLDMLRSAYNAAALDELHDQGNAALMRLNFQATVIPDASYPRSLGALQVRIATSTSDNETQKQFLSEWLGYANTSLITKTAAGTSVDPDIKDLTQSGILISIPYGSTQFAFPAANPEGSISGIGTDFAEAQWDTDISFGYSNSLMSSLSGTNPLFLAFCGATSSSSLSPTQSASLVSLREQAHVAHTRVLTYSYARKINSWLPMRDASAGIIRDLAMKHESAIAFQDSLHNTLVNRPECGAFARTLTRQAPEIAWGGLLPHLSGGGARIYEVGPREQVQQMSTTARSANSLSLAASLAATAPSSGTAADASFGFLKQAMGRATTLERIPSVLGYAVGGSQTFGWVLGPRLSLDPKGQIDVEQMLKSYDLTVDMSVPIWWTKLKLELSTIWAPSPRDLMRASLNKNADTVRTIEIPLSRRVPDFNWFTDKLVGATERNVLIKKIAGGPINACTQATLLITGRNVWRTEKVLVLGHLLDRSAFTIAPDMDGIVLTVPPLAPLAGGQTREPELHVLGPYGRDTYKTLAYAPTPSGDDCKPRKLDPATVADKNIPTIDKITPDLYFSVPSQFDITIQGTNLDKVSKVTLHNQPGSLKLSGTDQLTITFAQTATQGIPASDAIKLEFFMSEDKKSEKLVTSRLVRIVKN